MVSGFRPGMPMNGNFGMQQIQPGTAQGLLSKPPAPQPKTAPGAYQRLSPGMYRAPNGQIVRSQQMPQQRPMQSYQGGPQAAPQGGPGMVPGMAMPPMQQQPGVYQGTGQDFQQWQQQQGQPAMQQAFNQQMNPYAR